MKLSLPIIIFLVFFAPKISWADNSTNYKIITSHLAPWAMNARNGIFDEIVIEIEKRLGSNKIPQILPWSRAQVLAQTKKEYIIYPMTRIKERENKYKWIINVMPTELVFATINGERVDLEAARKLPVILVQQNSPPEIFLKRKRFTNLHLITRGSKKMPDMLDYKRVQAWFSASSLIKYSYRNRPNKKKLTLGPAVFRADLYIAASKDFPDGLVKEYRRVYKQLKKEGVVKKIMIKYLGE